MIRSLLYHIIPFLLPFVAYVIFVVATRRARERGELFDDAPWYWLFVVGLVLSGISLIVYWYFNQEPIGGTYVPPHVEDGAVVPGRVIRE